MPFRPESCNRPMIMVHVRVNGVWFARKNMAYTRVRPRKYVLFIVSNRDRRATGRERISDRDVCAPRQGCVRRPDSFGGHTTLSRFPSENERGKTNNERVQTSSKIEKRPTRRDSFRKLKTH
jgi:hypothetical protein